MPAKIATPKIPANHQLVGKKLYLRTHVIGRPDYRECWRIASFSGPTDEDTVTLYYNDDPTKLRRKNLGWFRSILTKSYVVIE